VISIILPTYNSEKYIFECISSVLNQSYKEFEIIVIDNNSSDKTLNIIRSFKSEKIKIFNIKNYGNISISRNLGIEKSIGNWIAFIDSDDLWEKDKLEILSNKFNDYDFIFHDMKIIKNQNEEIDTFRFKIVKDKSLKFIEYLSIKGNPIFNSSVIVKKNILNQVGRISEDQPSFTTDYFTWLKISLVSKNYYYEKKRFGSYRIHSQNLSSNIKNSYYYLKCIIQFKKHYSSKTKKMITGYFNYLKGIECFEQKKFKKGFKCFYKSIVLADYEIKIKSLLNLLIFPIKI